MHIFTDIQAAPPDPIYNLTTACNADPNPQKLNLGVGVYKDAAGHIPVLDTVKTAEQRILSDEDTKNYLPIDGTPDFGVAVRRLVLGADHPLGSRPGRITLHTPGGTGALRLACELVAKNRPEASVWLSDPTWTQPRPDCTTGRAGGAFIPVPRRGGPFDPAERKVRGIGGDSGRRRGAGARVLPQSDRPGLGAGRLAAPGRHIP